MLDELEGLVIPLKLRGAIDDPGVTVGVASVVAGLVRRKATNKLKEKPGLDTENNEHDGENQSTDAAEQLKKRLRGLFGK